MQIRKISNYIYQIAQRVPLWGIQRKPAIYWSGWSWFDSGFPFSYSKYCVCTIERQKILHWKVNLKLSNVALMWILNKSVPALLIWFWGLQFIESRSIFLMLELRWEKGKKGHRECDIIGNIRATRGALLKN